MNFWCNLLRNGITQINRCPFDHCHHIVYGIVDKFYSKTYAIEFSDMLKFMLLLVLLDEQFQYTQRKSMVLILIRQWKALFSILVFYNFSFQFIFSISFTISSKFILIFTLRNHNKCIGKRLDINDAYV